MVIVSVALFGSSRYCEPVTVKELKVAAPVIAKVGLAVVTGLALPFMVIAPYDPALVINVLPVVPVALKTIEALAQLRVPVLFQRFPLAAVRVNVPVPQLSVPPLVSPPPRVKLGLLVVASTVPAVTVRK